MAATKSIVGVANIVSDSYGTLSQKLETSTDILKNLSPILQSYASLNIKKINIDNSNIDEFIDSYKQLTYEQQKAALKIVNIDKNIKNVLQEQGIIIQENTAHTVMQTTATTALNTALAIGKQLLFSLGIGLAIAGVSKLIEAVSNLETEEEKLKNNISELNEELSDTRTEIDEVNYKIEELNKKIQEAGAKTIEDIVDPNERQKIQQINEDLERQLELLTEIERKSANEANKIAGELLRSENRTSINYSERKINVSSSGKDLTGGEVTAYVSDNITPTESVQEWDAYLKDLISEYYNSSTTNERKEELKALIESASEKLANDSKELQTTVDSFDPAGDNYEQYAAEIEIASSAIESATKTIAESNDLLYGTADISKTKVSEFKEAIEEFYSGKTRRSDIENLLNDIRGFSDYTTEAITNLYTQDPSAFTEEEQNLFNSLSIAANKYGITIEELTSVLAEYHLIQGTVAETEVDLTEQFEKINTATDNIQSAYSTMTTAMEEYNTHGYMSIDALQALVSLDNEYLSTLEMVDGKLQINKERYIELIQAQYAEMKTAVVKNAVAKLEEIQNGNLSESTESVIEATRLQKEKVAELVPAMQDATNETLLAAAANEIYAATTGDLTEEQIAAQQAVIDGMNAQLQALTDQMKAILDGSDFDKVFNGFDSETVSKTSEQVTDLTSAWTTLKDAMNEYNTYGSISVSTLNSLYDLNDEFTRTLIKQDGQLKINTASFLELLKSQIEEAKNSEDSNKNLEEMNRLYDLVSSSVDGATISFEELNDILLGTNTTLDEIISKTSELKSGFSEIRSVLNGNYKSSGVLDYDSISSMVDVMSKYPQLADAIYSEDGVLKIDEAKVKDLTVGLLKSIAEEIGESTVLGSAILESIEKVESGDLSLNDLWNGLGSDLSESNDALDKFQSSYNDLKSIYSEFSDYGSLSQDNYQKLIALAPEFANCIEYENGVLTINEQKFKELYIAKLRDIAATHQGTAAGEAFAKMADDLTNGVVSLEFALNGATDSVEEIKDALSDLEVIFSGILDLVNSGIESQTNSIEIWGQAMVDEIDNRIEALEEEKDALEKANEEEEKAIELQKLKDALEKAKNNKTVRQYTSNGYEWVADESAISEAQEALDDRLRDDRLEEAKEAIDDQIEALEDLKDKYSDVMDLIGESWDNYQERLKAEAIAAGMTIEEVEEYLEKYGEDVLANMIAQNNSNNTDKVFDKFDSVIEILKSILSLITFFGNFDFSNPESLIPNLIQGIFDIDLSEFNTLKNIISGLFSGDFSNGIKGIFSTIIKELTSFISGNSGIAGIVSKIISIFSGGGASILEIITSLAGGIGSVLTNIFGSFGSWIVGAVSSIGGGIGATLTGIMGSIGTWLSGTVATIGGGISTVVAAAGTALSSLGGPIGIAIAAILGLVTAIGSATGGNGLIGSFIQGVKTIVETAWNAVTAIGAKILEFSMTIFKGIVEGVTSAIGWIWEGVKGVVEFVGNGIAGIFKGVGDFFGGIFDFFGFAKGTRSVPRSGIYNVDEKGNEIIVRKPESGRYTYLEDGDGVIPHDITSRLFEIGSDPNRWFAKNINSMNLDSIRERGVQYSLSIGDININNPVGNVETLSREIVQKLPIQVRQDLSKR